MKKYFLHISFLIFITPTLVYAGAYNDVTLTTSAVIAVGGSNYSITGASAEVQSITVGATSFDITVASGSAMTILSSSQHTFSVTSDPFVSSTFNCVPPNSTLAITASGTTTVTITPSSACSLPAVGGGGGGGSPAPAPAPAPTPDPLPLATTTTIEPLLATTTTIVFVHGPQLTKTLQLGSTDPEVILLQQFLVDRSLLVLPSTIPLGYFGTLTTTAVMKFQKSAGLEQAGIVGPKTREAIYATTTATMQSSSIPLGFLFKRPLRIGSSGADVAALQQILIAKGFLVFNARSVPGYFGGLSKAAVVKFQKSLGLEPVGVVGPMTRSALNKITGAQ